MRALVLVAVVPGCATASRTWEAELPFDELGRAFGDVERGGLAYFGDGGADAVQVGFRAWAHAGGEEAARRRLASSRWGAEIRGDLLDLWARSPDPKAGVDIAAEGPADVDVDLLTVEGPVEAHGVRGLAVLTGSAVAGVDLHGSVDAAAFAGSAQIEAFPPDDGTVTVSAVDGDVVLYLPYGAPVDLSVRLDVEAGYRITDLGFDEVHRRPDRFQARTGEGTLRVDVDVVRGSFWLYEASSPVDPGSP